MAGNGVTSPEVTRSDQEVTSLGWKSPGSSYTRPTSQVMGTFVLLQGCNSQEVAVTLQEMTSRARKRPESDDLRPEVAWKLQ